MPLKASLLKTDLDLKPLGKWRAWALTRVPGTTAMETRFQ
jgi:hypothetical protein